MADISAIKLPDGVTYNIKDTSKSDATNWVNGSATGSVRTVGSAAEDNNYTMGTYAVAEGNSTKASGEHGSHAEGAGTVASGNGSHAEGLSTTASNYGAHAEGTSTVASGYSAHAEGSQTKAYAEHSHAEGHGTQVSSSASYGHAEGGNTTVNATCGHTEGSGTTVYGKYAHAEGLGASASGEASHAEGTGTYANGSQSHAEGGGTHADGAQSHAEGGGTSASGASSHAEGSSTSAGGLSSHAEGSNTIANHAAQHVFGEYNIADDSTTTKDERGNYVEIVGNGDINTRSNARTLDWSGNEVLAGKLTVGAVGVNSMDVATVGQLPIIPSNIVNTITTTAGAHTAISSQKGNVSFNVPTKTSHLTNDSGFITSYTDTKNTAGSTDTSSKIYLIGATSQAANPQTYSHDTAYVGTDGCLYSGGAKVLTAHQTYTNFVGTPTANQTPSFGGTVTICQISQSTTGQVSGADRTITIPATIATNTAVGLVKPWYTHTAASTGPTTGNNDTAVTVNAITTTSSRYYAAEADNNGRLFVNVPWTDTKVTTAALKSGTTYYPILATGTGTATRQIDSTLKGLRYVSTAGTTSAVGTAILCLGNTTESGTANNEQGVLRLYSSKATYYTDLKSSSAGSNKTITFPNATGTVALTSDISSTSTPTADRIAEFDSTAHMNSTDMTTGSGGEVEDFVNSLNITGGSFEDFVVEQGTSGGWKYRKWNSGRIEGWYKTSIQVIADQAFGNAMYYHSYPTSWSYPSSLFLTIDNLQVQPQTGDGFWWIQPHNFNVPYIPFYSISNRNASTTITIHAYMVGTWK